MILLDTSGLLAAIDASQNSHAEAAASLAGATPPRLLRVFDVGPGVAAGDPIVDASGAEVGTYTSVAAGKALGYVRRGAVLTSEV